MQPRSDVGVLFMSPQKENGYTPIAHQLFEAFYLCKMTEYERVIVMHIWRKTYGWGKKEDWISNSQFSDETGIPRPHVTRTLKQLCHKKLVARSGRKVSVNKHYQEWAVEWRKLPHQVTGVTSPGNKKLPDQVPTKESKETIQKKSSETKVSVNRKDMFNKYSEDHLEGDIDLDGDGSITDPLEEQKEKDRELNAKFRKAIDWLIKHQGRDPKRTAIPRQLKAIKKLYTMGVSASEAKQVILECEGSPVWQGRLEKPDYWTVVSMIQKRG